RDHFYRHRRHRRAARLARSVRSARQGAGQRGKAQGRERLEESARRQPRAVRPAVEGDRAVLRGAPHAAAQQDRDGRAADIHQAGLGRGLQFELFKPAAQERMADFYAELPINVKITGSYHDMGAFASDVAQLPRIVTLNDLSIVNDKGTLTMDAVAKTFRYLDEEEIAKQRQKAKDAAKGKGKK